MSDVGEGGLLVVFVVVVGLFGWFVEEEDVVGLEFNDRELFIVRGSCHIE